MDVGSQHTIEVASLFYLAEEKGIFTQTFFSSTLDVTIFSKTDPGVMFRAD